MVIQHTKFPTGTVRTPGRPLGAQKKEPEKKDSFWKDRSDELRELLLLMDQEKLEDAGQIVKSLGDGLKGAWQQIKDLPRNVFNLPVIKDKIDDRKQEELLSIAEVVGRITGFVAVGGHALGGALKIASGHQQKDTSRTLDGIMDIGTAATFGATVAGLTGAHAILAPLTATFNIFRGGYNAGQGYRRNDDREQVQGLLDSVRSAGSVGRILKAHGMFFKVAGVALAPIAGALQAGRGIHDLSSGIKNVDKKKQIKGLVDIATAVGTGAAFASGLAIIPGVALAVAANITKIAYERSSKVQKKIDPLLERWEPKLIRLIDGAERHTAPVRKAWNKIVSRFIKQREPGGLDRYSRAQLAEIAGVVFADGDYTRLEERRLKRALELTGQKADTPARDAEPPKLDRTTLKNELKSQEQRRDFLSFLILVSHYDNRETPEEVKYLNDLGATLGVSKKEMDELREAQANSKLIERSA